MYELLNGTVVELDELDNADLAFLLGLQRRAMAGDDYFDLERDVCGPGAYPLKGSPRVTQEIHDTPLFLVAEDVAYRLAIQQGVMAPNIDDGLGQTEGIMSVTEAAEHLGISRSAVVKAAHPSPLSARRGFFGKRPFSKVNEALVAGGRTPIEWQLPA